MYIQCAAELSRSVEMVDSNLVNSEVVQLLNVKQTLFTTCTRSVRASENFSLLLIPGGFRVAFFSYAPNFDSCVAYKTTKKNQVDKQIRRDASLDIDHLGRLWQTFERFGKKTERQIQD